MSRVDCSLLGYLGSDDRQERTTLLLDLFLGSPVLWWHTRENCFTLGSHPKSCPGMTHKRELLYSWISSQVLSCDDTQERTALLLDLITSPVLGWQTRENCFTLGSHPKSCPGMTHKRALLLDLIPSPVLGWQTRENSWISSQVLSWDDRQERTALLLDLIPSPVLGRSSLSNPYQREKQSFTYQHTHTHNVTWDRNTSCQET